MFSISGWLIVAKPNSRLIVFAGSRGEEPPIGYHYYVIEKGKLKFLRTAVVADGNFMEPLPTE